MDSRRVAPVSRLNTHIQQARDCTGSRVCMECTQNQVPGHGCGDGNFSRFTISDFSDHDNIWVVPQRTQSLGEGDFFGINLHLNDFWQIEFNRIFDGQYGLSLFVRCRAMQRKS